MAADVFLLADFFVACNVLPATSLGLALAFIFSTSWFWVYGALSCQNYIMVTPAATSNLNLTKIFFLSK